MPDSTAPAPVSVAEHDAAADAIVGRWSETHSIDENQVHDDAWCAADAAVSAPIIAGWRPAPVSPESDYA